MKKLLALRNRATVAALALASSGAAMASPYAPITTAVDWDDVTTGVIAVAALVAAVLVVIRGSRMLLSIVRR